MTTPRRPLTLGRALALPLVWLVRAYQLVVSPLRPPTCRFYPSCSSYAVTALERFGLVRGTWLAVRRLLRCHPWNPGGVDHVPALPAEPALPTDGERAAYPLISPTDSTADAAELTR